MTVDDLSNTSPLARLEKIAEGREAEIFAWDLGTILKLYRDPSRSRSRDAELHAMSAVWDAGGPAPRVIAPIEVDDRPGLLVERIDGTDLLTELGRAPWKVISTGGLMGEAHARLNQTKAPPHLKRLKDRLLERLESPLVPAELRGVGKEALVSLPDGDRLCHGDFHPANVMRSAHGGTVIDWSNATAGDLTADIAQTLLIVNLGEPPPGSALAIRRLDAVGRRIIRSRYLAVYARRQPFDRDLAARWTLPLRIARLSHGIEQERNKLLMLVRNGDT